MNPLMKRLALTDAGDAQWRSQLDEDVNQNGMAYGGLLLGQAMQALTLAMPADRQVTTLQFLFLRGGVPHQPLDHHIETVQMGRRFASYEARGMQDGRAVYRAFASCVAALDGPRHALASIAPPCEDPAALPSLQDLPDAWFPWCDRMGGYGRDGYPCITFRIPDAQEQIIGDGSDARFRFWVKSTYDVPSGHQGLHVSAFAYLSDWWLNFCMMRPHLAEAVHRRLRVSSLNHSIWFHTLPRTDDWIHVQTHATHSGGGHGLAVAEYHDRAGRHLATVTQDCLLVFEDD